MLFPRACTLILLFALPLLGRASDGYDEALLWRIERDGVAPSHLLGTMHSDDPRVLALSPKTAAALDGAARFIMELVPDVPAMKQVQQAMQLPHGGQLKAFLGEPLWQRLSQALRGRGVPPAAVATLQPWAVAVTLSMPPLRGPMLDQVLAQRAIVHGASVSGLESASEQMAVFDGLSDTEQRNFLRDTLDANESGQMAAYLEKMTEHYAAADLAGLVALANGMQASMSDQAMIERLMLRLIDERNLRMAERLQPELQHGGAFVAIGALHLPGEGGVLALLAKAGWRLLPIRD